MNWGVGVLGWALELVLVLVLGIVRLAKRLERALARRPWNGKDGRDAHCTQAKVKRLD
jgi:hypothetical protein